MPRVRLFGGPWDGQVVSMFCCRYGGGPDGDPLYVRETPDSVVGIYEPLFPYDLERSARA